MERKKKKMTEKRTAHNVFLIEVGGYWKSRFGRGQLHETKAATGKMLSDKHTNNQYGCVISSLFDKISPPLNVPYP